MSKDPIEKLYHIFKEYPQITTDSRNIPARSIFFALKGESFDGNVFASQALADGAAYAVIDNEKYLQDNCFLVEDVLETLQKLANHHRKQLNFPILAITGSNGKTTTKELINAVLSQQYKVVSTKGNLNNHIGVPLTLLSFTQETEIGIVEMGANHPGEIKTLCSIAEPDYGIITNIGKAHLEGFGGFEGVIRTKNELYQWLRQHNGKAITNKDNKLLMELVSGIDCVTYGKSEQADTQGILKENTGFLRLDWQDKAGNSHVLSTHLVGDYNFENVLAAVCVGNIFNIEAARINKAIESYMPSNSRSQAINTLHNFVILDAYNANPTSMRAAIENFLQLKAEKKMVILGDMLELGKESLEEHTQIRKLLEQSNFDITILVGKEFSSLKNNPFHTFSTSEHAKEYLAQKNITNYHILIKGSRGVKMENVLSVL